MLPNRLLRSALKAGLVLVLACGVCDGFAATSPVGSTNVTVADPPVPRPAGAPCAVQLFDDATFRDSGPLPYSYVPPTGCGTQWAKVVLEADFAVAAGRQPDYVASLWLDGVNLYFGTTPAATPAVSPSWHVERDLTDYSALLRQPGKGQAIVGNAIDIAHAELVHASVRLLFYRASAWAPAARAPDAIMPLGSDPAGDTSKLEHSGELAKTLSLPGNVERAYLDVFVQGGGANALWYGCVPDRYATQVQACGGGSFREAEVSIDGQAAGVAPVYPWIGGSSIDPYLWRPTSGVQTLDFLPYRVDLTPFAAVLGNGAPHRIALSVAGAGSYFSAAASLLLYLDPDTRQVSGRIVRNTLVDEPASPIIGSSLNTDADGAITGAITTQLSRHFVIEGFVDTSHGRVRTTVDQTVGFGNIQSFTIDADGHRQVTDQQTSVDSVSQRRVGGRVAGEYRQQLRYPLHLDIDQRTAGDGSTSVATLVHQGYVQTSEYLLSGVTPYTASVSNTVDGDDTLDFDAGGNLRGHSNQQSTQTFVFGDSLGSCYRSDVGSFNGAVASYDDGKGCALQRSQVHWFSRPDGSPQSVMPNR